MRLSKIEEVESWLGSGGGGKREALVAARSGETAALMYSHLRVDGHAVWVVLCGLEHVLQRDRKVVARRPVCSNNRPFSGSNRRWRVTGRRRQRTRRVVSVGCVGESYENGMQDDDDERVLYYRLGRWLPCPHPLSPPRHSPDYLSPKRALVVDPTNPPAPLQIHLGLSSSLLSPSLL